MNHHYRQLRYSLQQQQSCRHYTSRCKLNNRRRLEVHRNDSSTVSRCHPEQNGRSTTATLIYTLSRKLRYRILQPRDIFTATTACFPNYQFSLRNKNAAKVFQRSQNYMQNIWSQNTMDVTNSKSASESGTFPGNLKIRS